MPATGEITEFNLSFRFSVDIQGVGKAAFHECQIAGWGVQYEEIREGGQNLYTHKLIGQVEDGAKVTLKKGITNVALVQWFGQVLQGTLSKATRPVTIILYDVKRSPLFTWHFLDAIPVRWEGPNFDATNSTVAVETLEFVYHGYSLEMASR